MAEVIDLNAHRPHMAGPAICIECRHQWAAVAPPGKLSFECPSCKLMKGAWLGIAVPEENEKVWHCQCDNDLFFVTPNGYLCAKCGNFSCDGHAP